MNNVSFLCLQSKTNPRFYVCVCVFSLQEENEIPSSVFVKESPPFPRDVEENPALDTNRSHEEGLQTINLNPLGNAGLQMHHLQGVPIAIANPAGQSGKGRGGVVNN